MGIFKEILGVAYEFGLLGTEYTDCCLFIKSGTYSKVVNDEDLDHTGMIYKSYCAGYSEFEL